MAERLHQLAAAATGLTATDTQALAYLGISGPMSQRALANCVGLSTGAVTGLVDRLERHQVCKREPHPTDRRSSMVTVTARGYDVLGDLTALLRRAGRAVPADRHEGLAADLDSIADALSGSTRELLLSPTPSRRPIPTSGDFAAPAPAPAPVPAPAPAPTSGDFAY